MKPQRGNGFRDERLIVLPRPQLAQVASDRLLTSLCPTDVGHFPAACGHSIVRPEGCAQLILLYCTAGRGWIEMDGKVWAVEPGTAALIPPSTPHEYRADPDHPWTIYWLHAQGKHAEPLARRFVQRSGGITRAVGADRAVRLLFEELIHILSSPLASDDLLAACGVATHLLTRLITDRDSTSTDDGVQRRLDDTVAYMKQRIDGRIQINELAALARLSRSHFIATFRTRFGRPPLDYFLHLKMREAARLLGTTDLQIKQVSARVGTDDPLYFTRAFRRVFGVSPTTYRATTKR